MAFSIYSYYTHCYTTELTYDSAVATIQSIGHDMDIPLGFLTFDHEGKTIFALDPNIDEYSRSPAPMDIRTSNEFRLRMRDAEFVTFRPASPFCYAKMGMAEQQAYAGPGEVVDADIIMASGIFAMVKPNELKVLKFDQMLEPSVHENMRRVARHICIYKPSGVALIINYGNSRGWGNEMNKERMIVNMTIGAQVTETFEESGMVINPADYVLDGVSLFWAVYNVISTRNPMMVDANRDEVKIILDTFTECSMGLNGYTMMIPFTHIHYLILHDDNYKVLLMINPGTESIAIGILYPERFPVIKTINIKYGDTVSRAFIPEYGMPFVIKHEAHTTNFIQPENRNIRKYVHMLAKSINAPLAPANAPAPADDSDNAPVSE